MPFGRMRRGLVQRRGEADRETLFWEDRRQRCQNVPGIPPTMIPRHYPYGYVDKQAMLLRVILLAVGPRYLNSMSHIASTFQSKRLVIIDGMR